ncbi:phage protein [Paramagnetospirillum caucaseum]|uniref:Phage protein n=1 Tax=Paramagnetospirillum caucaseum TaxID=1244869 RepID=M2Y9M7_9PROT|nr:phage terminase large subunit [Paramagnetospirillum caucaseum]EME69726.1 phage protein [Paramagnetospirillum caucaseum]
MTGRGKRVTADDFLKSLAELAAEQRRLIETECPGFTMDRIASAQRRAKVLADDGFRFFCRTYFPHYIKGESSEFHEWLFDHLPQVAVAPEGRRELIAAPRGNAKSTVVTLLFTLWCLIRRIKRFPVILSDTFDQAAVHLQGLKSELEFNPRLRADFPDDTGAGPVWQAGEIVTITGAKVKIGGAGKALRGFRHGAQRPDLVIADDLENDENVKNPDQRNKLESWIDKTVEPLGPPDGSMDLIWVNTFLHYDAVAMRKSRNPLWRCKVFKAVIRQPDRLDLWERWEGILRNSDPALAEALADQFYHDHEAEMLAGSKVLWPAVQPLVKLAKIRVRIGDGPFSSEYQNEPMDGANQMFAHLTFWTSRLAEWVFVGACDPSMGGAGKNADPSAIGVGGFNRATGILDVVEASIRKRVPSVIMADIEALHREYKCLKWGVEIVQFQAFFAQQLVKESAIRGTPIPMVGIQSTTEKALRIESLEPHIRNGLIRIGANQAVLKEQLLFYPQAAHDDGPDMLEMLWQMAQSIRSGRSNIRTGGRRAVTSHSLAGFQS